MQPHDFAPFFSLFVKTEACRGSRGMFPACQLGTYSIAIAADTLPKAVAAAAIGRCYCA